ncbi:uncharacterized protein ARMOST_08288 [Armillaria ostoyae]|uniref:Uncharacterized protein n=1 Tax=Armillaria ostoyae TaxID=47428 RepID=A0A284R867_ARMOS|nr:uncharacterized protein ARMOST_08288 [Armillaria ostoyae]
MDILVDETVSLPAHSLLTRYIEMENSVDSLLNAALGNPHRLQLQLSFIISYETSLERLQHTLPTEQTIIIRGKLLTFKRLLREALDPPHHLPVLIPRETKQLAGRCTPVSVDPQLLKDLTRNYGGAAKIGKLLGFSTSTLSELLWWPSKAIWSTFHLLPILSPRQDLRFVPLMCPLTPFSEHMLLRKFLFMAVDGYTRMVSAFRIFDVNQRYAVPKATLEAAVRLRAPTRCRGDHGNNNMSVEWINCYRGSSGYTEESSPHNTSMEEPAVAWNYQDWMERRSQGISGPVGVA